MKKPFKVEQLVDQRNALTLYLEALLNEVEVDEDEALLDVTPGNEEAAKQAQTAVSSIDTGTADPVPATPATSSIAPVAHISEPADNDIEFHTSSQTAKRQEPPQWAIPRFQVLTFSLGGLKMAAPLDKLNGIIPFPERLTALPGQSPWFMGLARNRNQNVQVVDLETVVRPQQQVDRGGDKASPNSKYILLIDEGRWGILCNSISTVLTLEPQQVKWQRSSHVGFILGTVIDQMHSVLCVESLIERLNSGQLV